MFIAIILAGFWNLTSCSGPDVQNFDDGKFVLDQRSEDYKSRLRDLLTNPDTMVIGSDVILPPNFNIKGIVSEDTLPSGNISTKVLLSNGSVLTFNDSTSPEFDNMLAWTIKGYDSYNNVLYIMRNESYGFYRFFGINLYTGNEFTVYDGNPGGENDWMYEWDFSPDMKYLLKAGDLDNNEYGWSLVNLSNGIEFKKLHERYFEFATEPRWIGSDRFKVSYTKLPFVEGHEYTEDYAFFYSVRDGRKFQDVLLTCDYFLSKKQIFDLNGKLISEQFSKAVDIE